MKDADKEHADREKQTLGNFHEQNPLIKPVTVPRNPTDRTVLTYILRHAPPSLTQTHETKSQELRNYRKVRIYPGNSILGTVTPTSTEYQLKTQAPHLQLFDRQGGCYSFRGVHTLYRPLFLYSCMHATKFHLKTYGCEFNKQIKKWTIGHAKAVSSKMVVWLASVSPWRLGDWKESRLGGKLCNQSSHALYF